MSETSRGAVQNIVAGFHPRLTVEERSSDQRIADGEGSAEASEIPVC